MECPFIAVTPQLTLTWSGSTWEGPINGSNRSAWDVNSEKTNDSWYIELLEIELFDHLTVYKQMTDV